MKEIKDLHSCHISKQLSKGKVPSAAADVIISSWSKGTQRQYKYAWRHWLVWNSCVRFESPFQTTTNQFKCKQRNISLHADLSANTVPSPARIEPRRTLIIGDLILKKSKSSG
ncbi:hypothetical protein DPMN_115996 [Dreissena polymorpha]|uniref:Uncharacterized protein n=1 Tax=Dreissena polymorpha TaxID=45954 RepID=A0A9D4KMW4_DREPO|nr:hypothetical protein DPMN_115996 [Dreissena polymorpha]